MNEPECLHEPLSPKLEARLLRPEELLKKWLHELFTQASVPRPLRNPFKEIEGLEQILFEEE